jgi:tetratricopeptide (TPR) repeat protein
MVGESVTWTGKCESGFATGGGKAHWFAASGASSNQLDGAAVAGKLEGEIAVTYPDGSKYVGKLNSSGLRTGFGTLTYPAGLNDKGFFVDGEFVGEQKLDTPDFEMSMQKARQAFSGRHFSEAETIYENAINSVTKRLGPQHFYIAQAQSWLALAYIYGKQSRQSLIDQFFLDIYFLLDSSIDIFERYFGKDNVYDIPPLLGLGDLYKDQNEYSDAEKSYLHAINIVDHNQSIIGDAEREADRSYMFGARLRLATLYHLEGRYREAELPLQEALRLLEKSGISDDLETDAVLTELTSIYHDEDRSGEAENIRAIVLAISTSLFDENIFNTINALSNLAHTIYLEGRYSKAEELLRASLNVKEHILGTQHESLVVDLLCLGYIYEAQERYANAEAILRRTLSIDGENTTVISELIHVYTAEKKYSDMEVILNKLVNIAKTYDDDDLRLPDILDCLAMLLLDIGNNTDAENLTNAENYEQRAIKIRENVEGKDSFNIVKLLVSLGQIYEAETRYAEAISLYNRSLRVTEKAFGTDHPWIFPILNNIVKGYTYWSHVKEAIPLIDRLVAKKEIIPYVAYKALRPGRDADITSTEGASSLQVLRCVNLKTQQRPRR